MNRASVFEWHKRFNEGRESVREDERSGKSKEVIDEPHPTGVQAIKTGWAGKSHNKHEKIFRCFN